MKMLWAAIACASIWSLPTARADGGSTDAILFGHNMSPTTYTLHKGGASFGNFVAGVGITDKLTLGVSPWMYSSYNMYSVIGRYGSDLDDDHRLGVQAAYFKTDHINSDIYQMEATSVWLTLSRKITGYYTINLVANHMYFFDETVPFSLRREPNNNQPWQVSLTTLQEVRLPNGFGISAELGVLGLNYSYPQAFYGASMNWRGNSMLAQFGYSMNTTVSGANRLYTTQQAVSARDEHDDFSMHPEIHLQAFF